MNQVLQKSPFHQGAEGWGSGHLVGASIFSPSVNIMSSNGVLQTGGTQATSHKAPIKLNSEHSNMQSWVQRQCWQSHPERRAVGGDSVNRVKVSPSS